MNYLFQVDRNDGSCFLKSCMALCLVYDPGAPFCSVNAAAEHYFQNCSVIGYIFIHHLWFMLQNDLIHAWGLDMQLGYCAQAS